MRTALGVTRGPPRPPAPHRVAAAGCSLAELPASSSAAAALRLLVALGPSQLPRLARRGHGRARRRGRPRARRGCAVAFGLVPLRPAPAGRRRPRAVAGPDQRLRATWRVRRRSSRPTWPWRRSCSSARACSCAAWRRLLARAPGFDPSGVVTLQIWLSGERLRPAARRREQIAAAPRFYDELLTRVRALPGVTAASAVTTLPLGGGVDGFGLHVVGRIEANPEEAPSADRFVVRRSSSPRCASRSSAAGCSTSGDGQGTPRRGGRQPHARRIACSPGRIRSGSRSALGPQDADRRTIVGVVGDVRHHGLDVPVATRSTSRRRSGPGPRRS